jgi:hypothetical protein
MKPKLFIAVGLIVVITVVVGFMLLKDSKPSAIEIKDGNLIISGSFGLTVPVSGISDLNITEAAPKIASRTNGSGIGTVYKGEFRLEGSIKARIYADASKPPFITFNEDNTIFYINLATAEETQALYKLLTDALN